jgi:hypothetical protein
MGLPFRLWISFETASAVENFVDRKLGLQQRTDGGIGAALRGFP